MNNEKLKAACELVERFARAIDKDIEVIFCGGPVDEQVQVAALSWPGCVVEESLYSALTSAYDERGGP